MTFIWPRAMAPIATLLADAVGVPSAYRTPASQALTILRLAEAAAMNDAERKTAEKTAFDVAARAMRRSPNRGR
jgi:hypothetical protein